MGIMLDNLNLGGGLSNFSHNIGDIFYTTRTDNSLNGAVECNGNQYNFSDFDSNLQALFDDGKLPYLPIGKFDEMVTNQGGCDSFGYGTNELTLYPLELYQGSHYGTAYYSNVYDWEAIEPDPTEDYILHGVKIYDKDTHEELVGYTVKHHPLIGYDQWQLHNENDEYSSDIVSPSFSSGDPITLPTGGEFQTTTYFKVPKKLSRVLVRCKKPTEDDKSWYNVYADGWVEQGGVSTVSSGTGQIIFRDTLQVQLQNNIEYFISSSFNWDSGPSRAIVNSYLTSNNDKTINIVAETLDQSIRTGTGKFIWEVKGYAAPSEYTKDKWDYQNVQVERPMIQLFNSTTDTAIATCSQVLADISALKNLSNISEAGKENSLSWIFPDYSNSVNIKSYTSQSNQYTCPSYGWVFVSVRGEYKAQSILYINNIKFSVHSGNGQNVTSGNGLMMPVRKNDTIYINDTDSETVCLFFPVGI